MNEQKQTGELETWAIVEVMGHSKYAGYAKQVAMGGGAMIRVDVPELPEKPEKYREYDYEKQDYVEKQRTLAGMPPYTKFLGISSIFAITPCTEEVARAAVESFRSPAVTVLAMPTRRALPGPGEDDGREPQF